MPIKFEPGDSSRSVEGEKTAQRNTHDEFVCFCSSGFSPPFLGVPLITIDVLVVFSTTPHTGGDVPAEVPICLQLGFYLLGSSYRNLNDFVFSAEPSAKGDVSTQLVTHPDLSCFFSTLFFLDLFLQCFQQLVFHWLLVSRLFLCNVFNSQFFNAFSTGIL
tara:strand:- start:1702 stop:2184 length:483 start_codon:yes stop_codon:yes gene_type:complete